MRAPPKNHSLSYSCTYKSQIQLSRLSDLYSLQRNWLETMLMSKRRMGNRMRKSSWESRSFHQFFRSTSIDLVWAQPVKWWKSTRPVSSAILWTSTKSCSRQIVTCFLNEHQAIQLCPSNQVNCQEMLMARTCTSCMLFCATAVHSTAVTTTVSSE